MDKNIIKEQEYVRIDEESELPRDITHNGEKYVRCDDFEKDLQDCKDYIKMILQNNPAVIEFSPIRIRILNGSAFFLIKELIFNPNTKVRQFKLYAMSTFRSKLVGGFSTFGWKYNDMSFTSRGDGKDGYEKWELNIQAVSKKTK
ncbi:hypothetical protein [Helicobacter marmotae]|uniref:Uncharacterized protein n=1 Tax=Helicobacter marmotae TaxID=152490 RepID=A0A3D8I417_9HELI|nr:hypothetical protein [Helicobacter marmotae]RDU59892.1 hypothetical protein CQA63_04740 [Helicobacter marmotae]